MELLLNFFWLTLALPALWLWRREGQSSRASRRFDSLHRLLVLSCGLMLLFPVVSATDDLHPMRAEIEESRLSKRMLSAAGVHKTLPWTGGADLTAVPAGCWLLDEFCSVVCGKISSRVAVRVEPAQFNVCAGRAPPLTLPS